jgi:subtilisin family serine protease
LLLPAAAALAAVVAMAFAVTSSGANASATQTYIVLYKQSALPANVESTIRNAGGTLVAAYSEIGVAIARSDSTSFRQSLLSDSKIEGAAASDGFGVRLPDTTAEGPPGDLPNFPANDSAEPLFPLQWDMSQIHTPEAHAITGGSPSVVAGDIDTGLDFTHPDIAPNYDAANSADCSSGSPAPLLPGNDQNGHGTHTAGTIAAAANGIGIVGVAPNVKIAGIKSSNDDGFFFPEMVVCSFMWAGSHNIDVTNNSYFADPWLFNCRNDPEQRAIWKAERRAIGYAMKQGVVVVAAAGNFSDDLAHPTMDIISPDFPPGSEEERRIRNDCAVVPVEVPGVVGVAANGNRLLKSFYSSYGVGVTDVIAPGGDSILQQTAAAPNGRVLSTYPAAAPCLRTVFDPGTGAKYCYLQGTSMASPHVTGVAALVRSMFAGMPPGAVGARINQTADSMACPDTSIYVPFPSVSNGAPQVCQGNTGYNSFNGHGQVNALSAVS